MNFADYLKDKSLLIILNISGVLFLSMYLIVIGNNFAVISVLGFFWLGILSLWLLLDYRRRRKYFSEIFDLLADLEKPYLIQKFMGKSWKLEDKLYQQILRLSNKSVIEKIQTLEDQQKEYREFIEGWIHEVKLPITGMRLVAYNESNELKRKSELYLTEMDELVDKALFYARSDQVYKDYAIKETDLKTIVKETINKYRYILIENQIKVTVLTESAFVQTDGKWIEFILSQIVANAIKYKKPGAGEITFSVQEVKDGIKLSVRDNGIGVPSDELKQIFEKGYTGTNGRSREKTTGIGLYLCKKLCKKLDLTIGAASVEKDYTEIYLVFPVNSYLSKL